MNFIEEAHRRSFLDLSPDQVHEVKSSARSRERVNGLTHSYYRYPARLSPVFVRSVIDILTNPGDVVVDPFVGGGTTMVEAKVAARHCLGMDVNELATFVTRAKTDILTSRQLEGARKWLGNAIPKLNCHAASKRPTNPRYDGYWRNINGRSTWPVRKLLEIALGELSQIEETKVERLLRCLLLRTGQWALDGRRTIPTASDFRRQLEENGDEMIRESALFAQEYVRSRQRLEKGVRVYSRCHCNRADSISTIFPKGLSKPKLVLTSPPYPGVHVLYHRWQVEGRRETPAAFWLANKLDGHGESYYSMGGRHLKGIERYWDNLESSFKSVVQIADRNTVIVQVVSFSNVGRFLPEYLRVLDCVGLRERFLPGLLSPDGRLWRKVPNRKWYTAVDSRNSGSEEVVLFHSID